MSKLSLMWHLLLTTLLITALSCSSNDKKDEAGNSDVAEATADEGAPAGDQAAADQANADNGLVSDPNAAPETKEGDVANNPPPEADPNAPVDPNAAPADPNAPPAVADANPPPEAPSAETPKADAGSGDLFGAGAASTDTGSGEPPAPRKSYPLAHIKDMPFEKGGQNLNTVYIARDGDTLDSISQKLFGEDKTKELKKANPSLKKGVKTGDKVYFNSPNRPDDKEKMLIVYEDQGLPPSTYQTKDGDTLKSLAQEWYGSEASYKEIYAINRGLASPKELPPGTDLQYWPAAATVAVYGVHKEPEVAQAPPPAPPPPAMTPAPVVGSIEPPAPPPPTTPDLNAAAPPPPPIASKRKKDKDAGMDKDTVMYAALGGVLLVGGGALVAIRRRNARRSQGLTQV